MSPFSSVVSLWGADALGPRDIGNSLDDARTTLSSWDNCMAKAYCKWPVIVAIIVAALIVLSLVVCCARCLCCGLDCCFGCFSCCNACCPSPRGRRRRDRARDGDAGYLEAPSNGSQPFNFSYPQRQPTYTSQEPMTYGAAGQYGPGQKYGPQFATYDAPSKNSPRAAVHEDALPSMPTWDQAEMHHVENDAHHEETSPTDFEKEALVGSRQAIPMAPVGNTRGNTASVRSDRSDLRDEAYAPMLNNYQPSQDQYGRHTSPPPVGGAYNPNPYGPLSRQQTNSSYQNQNSYSGITANGPYGPPSDYPPSYHTRLPSASDYQTPTPAPLPGQSPPYDQKQSHGAGGVARANTSRSAQSQSQSQSPIYSASVYSSSTRYGELPDNSGVGRSNTMNTVHELPSPAPPQAAVQQPASARRPPSELFYGGSDATRVRTVPQSAQPQPQRFYAAAQMGNAAGWGEPDTTGAQRKPVKGSWREI